MPILDPSVYSKLTGDQKDTYIASISNAPGSIKTPLQSGVSTLSPIVVSDLNKKSAVFNAPEPPESPNYSSITSSAIAGATTPPKTYTAPNGAVMDAQGNIVTPAPSQISSGTKEDSVKSFEETLKGILGSDYSAPEKQPSLVDQYRQLQQETGMVEKQKIVDDLQAQLNELNVAAAIQSKSLETEDVRKTLGVLGRQQSAIERDRAFRALSLSAQLNSAQGRLQSAQSNLQTMMDLQYKDYEAKKDYNDQLYERAFAIADKEYQQKLDEWKAKKDAESDKQKTFLDNKKFWADRAQSAGDYATASKILVAQSEQDLAVLAGQLERKAEYKTYSSDGKLYQYQVDPVTGQAIGTPQVVVGGTGVGGGEGGNLTGLTSIASLLGGFGSVTGQKVFMQSIESLAKQGNEKAIAEKIVGQALDNTADADTRKRVIGGFKISQQLSRLQSLLAEYEKSGGQTGLISGSVQNIKQKLGQLGDAKLANIGTQILNTLDTLARSRTGAVITESEEKFYKKMLPSTDKVGKLNTEVINGLRDSLIFDVENQLRFSITNDGLQAVKQYLPDIFYQQTPQSGGQSIAPSSIDDAYNAYLEISGQAPMTSPTSSGVNKAGNMTTNDYMKSLGYNFGSTTPSYNLNSFFKL